MNDFKEPSPDITGWQHIYRDGDHMHEARISLRQTITTWKSEGGGLSLHSSWGVNGIWLLLREEELIFNGVAPGISTHSR